MHRLHQVLKSKAMERVEWLYLRNKPRRGACHRGCGCNGVPRVKTELARTRSARWHASPRLPSPMGPSASCRRSLAKNAIGDAGIMLRRGDRKFAAFLDHYPRQE